MSALSDMFLAKSMQPQSTGYMGAYNQGQQQAYNRNLSDSLASGAPREQVLGNLAYVDPISAGKEMGYFGNTNQNATKSRITQLEQLWKDANRSLTFAKQTGNAQDIVLYENLIKNLSTQLRVIAPDTWADFGTATDTQNVNATQLAPKETKVALDAKLEEMKNLFTEGPQDAPKVRADLDSWALSKGIATSNPLFKVIQNYIDSAEKKQLSERDYQDKMRQVGFSQGMEEKRFEQSGTKDKIQQDEKFLMPWNMLNDLKKNPSITNVRAALNVKLRDESGAAIGQDEFNNMMAFVLPDQTYSKMKSETQNIWTTILGTLSGSAKTDYLAKIAETYLGDVDAEKLASYMDKGISPEYYKKKEASGSNDGKQAKGKPSGKKLSDADFKKLMGR